jgi:hypothetical protein
MMASVVGGAALGLDLLDFSVRYIDTLEITPESSQAQRFGCLPTWSPTG